MENKQNPFLSPDMKQYFNSLPAFVQESIEQSGVSFNNVNELRTFVQNLNQS